MNINKTNNLNFTGSFIINGNLSSQSKKLLEAFKRYSLEGISNESIISKKCYDVFVSKSPTSENLILFSKFNYFEDEAILKNTKNKELELKEKSKLLLILNPNKSINNSNSTLFRKRLENFEKSKDNYCGFNSKLEYWKKRIMAYFS